MEHSIPKRVLVLEDELLIAMELQALLEEQGCEVIGPVSNCEAVLELMRSKNVDAAILDLFVEGERCDRVADELFAKGVPLAIATGADAELVDYRYDKSPIINKPYGSSDVIGLLRQLLGPEGGEG
jgi:AmiR/NasT family two-component response regulator